MSRILEISSSLSRHEFGILGSFKSLDFRVGVGQLSGVGVGQVPSVGVGQLSSVGLGQLSRHRS